MTPPSTSASSGQEAEEEEAVEVEGGAGGRPGRVTSASCLEAGWPEEEEERSGGTTAAVAAAAPGCEAALKGPAVAPVPEAATGARAAPLDGESVEAAGTLRPCASR